MAKLFAPAVAASGVRFEPKSTADVVERLRLRTGEFHERPVWLQQYVDLLDSAVLEGDVRATCAVGPQHGKSTVGYGALLFAAIRRPGLRHAFLSYAQSRSDDAALDLYQHAQDLGLAPCKSGPMITLRGGTTIFFSSIDGSLTGRGIDGLALVDDPIKGQAEARSPTLRRKINRWFWSDVESRLHPPSADGSRPGASIVVVATRWHPDDLTATLKKDDRFSHIRLAALCDDEDDGTGRKLGEPLWPAQRPLRELRARQGKSPRMFAALYQGLPVPDEDRIFGDPVFYEERPMAGQRWGWGLDVAATAKQTADYSVLVGGCLVGDVLYVTDLYRVQKELTVWIPEAAELVQRRRSPVMFYASGSGDAAAAQMLRAGGVPVMSVPAREDKLVRARKSGLVEAWAEGRVQFPLSASGGAKGGSWVEALEEIASFTGLGDGHDDVVDALTALCVAVRLPSSAGALTESKPFLRRTPGLRGDPGGVQRGDRDRAGAGRYWLG